MISAALHTHRVQNAVGHVGQRWGESPLAPRRAARAGIAQLPQYFVCAGPIQHQTHIDSRCATHTPCPDPCGWRRKTQLGLWGTGYQNRLRRAARGGIAQLPHCFVCPGPIQNQTRPGSSCAGRPSRLCRWCWQRGPWLCLCGIGVGGPLPQTMVTTLLCVFMIVIDRPPKTCVAAVLGEQCVSTLGAGGVSCK